MIAGTLEVEMMAKMARLQQDLNQAKNMLSGFEHHAVAALDTVKKAAAALGAGLGVAAFAHLIRGAIDAADHLNDLSKKTGIAVEELGGLGFAAKQAGGNLDSMTDAAGKLNRAIAGAAAGNKEQAEAFKVLGINVKDASGNLKSADQVMVAVADQFERFADGPNKVALAIRLFGKAGADMIPLLDEGGQKLTENIEYFKRYSGVTQDVATKADQFNDTLEKLHLLAGALGTRIAADLLGTLQRLADLYLESKEKGEGLKLVSVGLDATFKAAALGIEAYRFILTAANTSTEQMAKNWDRLKNFDFKGMLGAPGESLKAQAENVRQANENIDRILGTGRFRLTAADIQDRESGGITAIRRGTLPQAPGLTDDKAADQEAKKFASALQSLEQQLGALNHQTEAEKLLYQVTAGSLRDLTEAHKQELIAVAKKIDAKKDEIAQSASLIAAIEAQLAARNALDASTNAFFTTNATAIKDLQFETSLIGLNTVEREKAVALRKIEADRKAAENAIPEGIGMQALTEQLDKLTKERDASVVAINAEIDAKNAKLALDPKVIAQIEFETKLIGLNTVEREQAIAERALELIGIKKNTEQFETYVATLKKAIAEREFAKESQRVLVDVWRNVDQAGRDTFASIFDKGDDALKRLRDSLKKNLIDVLYAMTAQPFLIRVVTSTAGSGVAEQVFGPAATQRALSGAGGIGNLFSGASSLSNLFGGGGLGGALFGGSAAYAAAVPGLTSLGAGSQAALLAAQTGVFGAEGLAATAVSGGASAATGTALSALGTAAPYIGIALAAASALGLFGGSKKIPARGLGGFTQNFTDGQLTQEYASPYGGDAAGAKTTVDALVQRYKVAASLLGATNQFLSFTYDSNSGGQSEHPNFALRAQAIQRGGDPSGRIYAVGEALGRSRPLDQATLDLEGSRAILAALQGSTLPGYLRKFFDALTPETMDKAAVDNALAFAAGLKAIKDQLGQLFGASKATDALVEAVGFLPDAANLLQAFYDNFYSEAERTSRALDSVNGALATLGLSSLPKTRAEFRALIEAQDTTTEAGRQMFAGLLQLAPAFAAVTQQLDAAAVAADTLAGRLAATQAAAFTAIADQISASQDAARQAAQTADSYRQITESLLDAVARIRGTSAGAGGFQSLFTTAMTGDASALGKLPGAAEDALAAALASSRTAIDYARERAHIAGMLEQAAGVSQAGTNWNEYQASLLETQVSALEAIKAALELPDPSADALRQQKEVLATIADLLREQTVQIVTTGAQQRVISLDQTGHIIENNAINGASLAAMVAATASLDAIRGLTEGQLQSLFGSASTLANIRAMSDEQLRAMLTSSNSLDTIRSLTSAQLVELLGAGTTQDAIRALTGTQTQQIITGNVVQDTIKNISAAGNNLTEEMLKSLVANNSTQTGTFEAMLQGSDHTVSLLQQMLTLMGQSAAQAAATAEAEKALAAERAKAAELARAHAAYDAQKAVSDSALSSLRQYVSTTGGGELLRVPEDIAARQAFDYEAFYNLGADIVGAEQSMLQKYLAEFYKAYELFKAIPGHAGGGMASGWSWVGERGPELAHFGSPTSIYSNADSRAMMLNRSGSDNTAALAARVDALIEEVRGLRMEQRSGIMTLARHSKQTADIMDRVTQGNDSVRVTADSDAPLPVDTTP